MYEFRYFSSNFVNFNELLLIFAKFNELPPNLVRVAGAAAGNRPVPSQNFIAGARP